MNTVNISVEINRHRRRFLGTGAMAIAAAEFGVFEVLAASAQDPRPPLADEGPMPDLGGAIGWLNSAPLDRKSLRGKVVLADFWTYTCINSLRPLPYVKSWAAKYEAAGLVVIGVHTPEFSFEKERGNVENAVHDLKVTYSVAIDSNYRIWHAFNNQYWPALYLIDGKGQIRYHHFGEGDYGEGERVIQELLKKNGATGVDGSTVSISAEGVEAAPSENVRSPESYIGYRRAERFKSPERLARDLSKTYSPPVRSSLNQTVTAYSDTQIYVNVTPATAGTGTFTVTSEGFGGQPFQSSAGQSQKSQPSPNVTAGYPTYNTVDVTIVAWVNAASIVIPGGENAQLYTNLITPGLCSSELGLWAAGTPANLKSAADVAYANAFLLAHSGNTNPGEQINPASVLAGGDFRLFSRLQGTFSVVNGYISSPHMITGAWVVGSTPDPCGVLLPVAGQNHPNNGATGVTTSGTSWYLLTEGRLGSVGQAVNETLNDTTTAWIFDVIEFGAAGVGLPTLPPNTAIFPTYSIYVGGVLTQTVTQSNASSFIALNANYQLLPSQIN